MESAHVPGFINECENRVQSAFHAVIYFIHAEIQPSSKIYPSS